MPINHSATFNTLFGGRFGFQGIGRITRAPGVMPVETLAAIPAMQQDAAAVPPMLPSSNTPFLEPGTSVPSEVPVSQPVQASIPRSQRTLTWEEASPGERERWQQAINAQNQPQQSPAATPAARPVTESIPVYNIEQRQGSGGWIDTSAGRSGAWMPEAGPWTQAARQGFADIIGVDLGYQFQGISGTDVARGIGRGVGETGINAALLFGASALGGGSMATKTAAPAPEPWDAVKAAEDIIQNYQRQIQPFDAVRSAEQIISNYQPFDAVRSAEQIINNVFMGR